MVMGGEHEDQVSGCGERVDDEVDEVHLEFIEKNNVTEVKLSSPLSDMKV